MILRKNKRRRIRHKENTAKRKNLISVITNSYILGLPSLKDNGIKSIASHKFKASNSILSLIVINNNLIGNVSLIVIFFLKLAKSDHSEEN